MFSELVRRLPIGYVAFSYRMKRDISNPQFVLLQFFQSFDDMKVYYDDGQDIVRQALDQSFVFVLPKGVVERRKTFAVGLPPRAGGT